MKRTVKNKCICGACRMFSRFYRKDFIRFAAEKRGWCRALQKIAARSDTCAEFCCRAPARTGLTRKIFKRALEDIRFLEKEFDDPFS